MTTQRLGAYAAIVAGLGDAMILIIFFVVFPSAGLTQPSDFTNPAQLAKVAGTLRLLDALDILFGLLGVFTVRALADRMAARAPVLMRWSMAAVIAASALFIAAGVVGLSGRVFGDPLLDALGAGGVGVFGLSVILAGVAALRTGGLPRGLAVLSCIAGGLGVLSFLNPLIQMAEVVTFVVWTFWLAAVLLRRGDALRDSRTPIPGAG